jgi:hypothetical protein
MRAHVTKDTSTRTIELELEGLPDLDITQSWHSKPRAIRPDKAIIHINSGETRSINVLGYLVKKSGAPSDSVRDNLTFTTRPYRVKERLDQAPGWVRELFTQAPYGVTTFTWISEEEAQVL